MYRSQMKYHPRIGYTYMPNIKMRVPTVSGGYLVRTNTAGYRADREYTKQREPGKFRVLLFGDSQTAGDGVANNKRYSDLLENITPKMEIYNFGLSGTGPDQQFLAYQECSAIEHDLLIVCINVENIRRISRSIIKSLESDGTHSYYAKPYYQLNEDELILNNVPVPKKPWTEDTLSKEQRTQVYSYLETNLFMRAERPMLQNLLTKVPFSNSVKNLMLKCSHYQPLPEYETPDHPDWLLLRSLLQQWIANSHVPVLLVAIPHYIYLKYTGDPSGYQARFRELSEDTGCYFFDPLPEFLKLSDAIRLSLWNDASGHLSSTGHEYLAKLLDPLLQQQFSYLR